MLIKTESHEELNDYAKAWADGKFQHLYLMGKPGSGKTHTVKAAISGVNRVRYWDGHLTPKRLYGKLAEWMRQGVEIIVFDDIYAITKNDAMAELLKQVMGGGRVSWASTQQVGDETIETNFKICIITNNIGVRNDHILALQSRSMTLAFEPRAQATLEHALNQRIITKQIYDHINHVGFPASGHLDLRMLERLRTIKDLGKDWKSVYQDNLSHN